MAFSLADIKLRPVLQRASLEFRARDYAPISRAIATTVLPNDALAVLTAPIGAAAYPAAQA
jgi:hypothetical protein